MTLLERANDYQKNNRIPVDQRPVYHITPPIGWMNDPNGFSVYQGRVHLFYQYHPYSDKWGPMHWGHYISNDFITWKELPVALAPDQEYDVAGCFSGSAIETDEGHILLYTGVMEEEQADGSKISYQNQCMAIGDGISYNKLTENPVISATQLPEGFSQTDFRDPKIWKEDGIYYLVAGNKNEKDNGQVVLFQSKDLRKWDYLSVLSDNQNGTYGMMWECPDFFSLGEKYILIVSPQYMLADGKEFHNGNQSIALIGDYDRSDFKLLDEQIVSLDYGTDFYAPQTLETEDGRRIMIAWMHSWDMEFKPQHQKWNGMMTVPRELQLKEGRLYQNPVKEIETYWTESAIWENQRISGVCTIPEIQGRVLDMTIEILEGDYQKFVVHFAHNEKYDTCFIYDHKQQCITFDRTFSGVQRDVVCERNMVIKDHQKHLKLRLLFDHQSVELFVNDGRQAFSAIIYTPLEADDIIFECDGELFVNIEKHKIQVNAL